MTVMNLLQKSGNWSQRRTPTTSRVMYYDNSLEFDEACEDLSQNAVVICEMFKISWQRGKHFVSGELENHLKDRSFRWWQ